MKIHITNLYGQAADSVAMQSQQMVTRFARELGFHEIGIYSYPMQTDSPSELSKRIDGMLASLSMGDIVIVQSPSWNTTAFDSYFFNKLKSYAGVKVVIFVHDIVPLMFERNAYLMPAVIEIYNNADVLILPSKQMESELRSRGLTASKVIIQHMWDHPNPLSYKEPAFVKQLLFAGEAERFSFINDWQFETPLINYAFHAPTATPKNLVYKGWKADEYLMQDLADMGGFGLVWPQTDTSQYYEWNISYKLSTYLAAGLPVVVPDNLSNTAFIQHNRLGFVVTSLEEANQKIQTISKEEYLEMVANVRHYRELIINGYFSKKVLVDSVHAVLSANGAIN